MFDTVIFQGMDMLEFGVKASDGALQELIRHASKRLRYQSLLPAIKEILYGS